jgi:hypothetical protein
VAREALLSELRRAIGKTADLPALGVRVVAARGFLHFDRPTANDPKQWENMARALPRVEGGLLLEAQSARGGYLEVVKGSTAVIVRTLAEGAAGTFHGLGPIEQRARRTKRKLEREAIIQSGEDFVYAADGAAASVPEVLCHHFELPRIVAGEPRGWYAYHRRPKILEIAAGRLLVGFFSTDSIIGPPSEARASTRSTRASGRRTLYGPTRPSPSQSLRRGWQSESGRGGNQQRALRMRGSQR